MDKKRLQVTFPGVGYHCDKPLLYYARKLAIEAGYEEIINISYSCPVEKIRGDEAKMKAAFESLYQQAEETLKDVNWVDYSDILFISKSIGTIIAATYARKHGLGNVKQLLYTPLSDTINALDSDNAESAKALAFIGSEDPWSNVPEVIEQANQKKIPIILYDGLNHSLESENTMANLDVLRDVMAKSREFIF